jgi:hypothetical protein
MFNLSKKPIPLFIILLCLYFSSVYAQITDPIPEPISKSGIAVTFEKLVKIPNSDGSPARLNVISTAGDGSQRLFVNDQRGKFYVIIGTSLSVYLDMQDFLPRFVHLSAGQSGFTYFVFHPQFATNGTFYTIHSEQKSGSPDPDYPLTKAVINNQGEVISSSHHDVITEWITNDPLSNEFSGSFRELLRIEQPYRDHNLGQLVFNPNALPGNEDYGLLYIASADGGNNRDPLDMGQDLSTPFGVILRIDPQGNNSLNGAYGIPESNPFVMNGNANSLDEIWSYGHRNPHRITWDTEASGIMLISEIGQAFIEEINLGVKGQNYGWSEREGTWLFDKMLEDELLPLPANDNEFGFTYPVAQYDHPDGPGAIAGGIIYRGSAIDNLQGQFVFADFTAHDTWFHVPVDALIMGQQAEIFEIELRQPDNPNIATTFSSIIGNPGGRTDVRFGIDNDGEILVINKQDGWVRKLIASPGIVDNHVLDIRVSASADDAEENTTTGKVNRGSSDLELVDQGALFQLVGMRFNNLTIPQGAIINKASIQFQADETHSGTTTLMIKGQATDNALTFTNTNANISSRDQTNAIVDWTPVPWTTVGEAGFDQQTPDIALVVQEIIERPGWSSGNSLVIIINGRGRRAAESFNGDTAGAPVLHVEYTTSSVNIVESRVAASADDAEENTATGKVNRGSSDLELVDQGALFQLVGMRFNSLSIPQGATITNASIQFQADETHSGATNLMIEGEASDNALAFTNANANISSRTLTATSVEWTPAPWTTVGEAGSDQQTPDITSVIQEIVDRPGWSSGNSLAVIISGSGRRAAESFNGDSAGAPLLHVEYTAGTGTN